MAEAIVGEDGLCIIGLFFQVSTHKGKGPSTSPISRIHWTKMCKKSVDQLRDVGTVVYAFEMHLTIYQQELQKV